MNPFNTPFGTVAISCDNSNDNSIQAWNQADAYLLNMLEQHPDLPPHTLGIINDEWGALSIATQTLKPLIYSDSAIFADWLHRNSHGRLTRQSVQNIPALATSVAQVFLMRLPKNLHFFQHQLSLLSQLPHITVYVAGMQKYWPATFFKTADDYFDSVEFFPGVKKAKCMKLQGGKNNQKPEITNTLHIEDIGLEAVNYPNVFSRESLDIGTRFFLENFPDLSQCNTIIDLACGNGLLGIQALKKYPQLHTTFIDESYYATQACAASLQANAIDKNRYDIIHNNAIHHLALHKVDAILCNPPFHQLHRIGDHIASTMILQSDQQLQPGGSLYLIGNRHLQYQVMLKKFFSKVELLAENSKFVLLKAVR